MNFLILLEIYFFYLLQFQTIFIINFIKYFFSYRINIKFIAIKIVPKKTIITCLKMFFLLNIFLHSKSKLSVSLIFNECKKSYTKGGCFCTGKRISLIIRNYFFNSMVNIINNI